MRICSFQIENYKSYRKTEKIDLSPGFNIVVAPNNVGKTALLEILSTRFSDKPHRSIKIARSRELPPKSSIHVALAISGKEFKDFALNKSRVILPIPPKFQNDQKRCAELFRDIANSPGVIIECEYSPQTGPVLHKIQTDNFALAFSDEAPLAALFDSNQLNDDFDFKTISTTNKHNLLFQEMAVEFQKNTYNFLAERLNIGTCAFGSNTTLRPDASNLAEVLDNLQSNLARFERFNAHISDIFENVRGVVSRPSIQEKNNVEIVVWTVDPRSERDDLATELKESGTGIGQVLAMIYVVMTSEEPRVIIIDEPNTFLHPGAAKKLIQILSQYPQHQYIFATHSPEIIRVSEPGTVIAIRWEDGESKLVPIDAEKIEDLQSVLMDVGVKLSDVFGADTVLWVEGFTEEACFDLILRRLGKRPYLGVSILAVRSTGEFESKRADADAIWEIYEKLSTSRALMPPAIAFVFDREGRTERQMEDLSRRSSNRVRFIPRRTYENYLIHPSAITALMNTLPTFSETAITEALVRGWLLENGDKNEYCAENLGISDLVNPNWLEKVHGAKLLAHLFKDLSEEKEEFRKRSHSLQLTEWLIENDPDCLKELVDFLSELLPQE